MKKFIAVTIVAVMMLAFAASSFALVVASTPGTKNPPVYIDGLVVSDAYMSGLTMTNWNQSLSNQAYAENSYIWFIAKIGVAASGDSDGEHLWRGAVGDANAVLTVTGKDGCLDFSSASMATLARINGMSVDARGISNNMNIVEAGAKQAKFTFSSRKIYYDMTSSSGDYVDASGVVVFNADLASLELDPILGKNNADISSVNQNIRYVGTADQSRATTGKNYYLHFMAITKAATEGECIATMKVSGEDTFVRGFQLYAIGSYTSAGTPWYNPSATSASTELKVGDRSSLYMLYNTYNGRNYSIMKIKNGNFFDLDIFAREAVTNVTVNGTTPPATPTNALGPYGGKGHIYVVMNAAADEPIIGFVVDGNSFLGLVKWNKDNFNGAFGLSADWINPAAPAGGLPALLTSNGHLSWMYEAVTANYLSSDVVAIVDSLRGDTAITSSEVAAIFEFFGYGYANPVAPTDATFLIRSALTSTASAKYNVANAVIQTPDTSIVVPKTGDEASSVGMIMIASAIMAAAAVGFVLSKRARTE